jgi:hypothetical protein
MGYLLGIDCADVDKEESQMCIVDRLVLPLVSIIFPTDGIAQQQSLDALRRHCQRAFTLSFKGKRDLELFALPGPPGRDAGFYSKAVAVREPLIRHD